MTFLDKDGSPISISCEYKIKTITIRKGNLLYLCEDALIINISCILFCYLHQEVPLALEEGSHLARCLELQNYLEFQAC